VIECSTFTGNRYDGLSADVDGTISVSGCTFGGNGESDIDVSEGQLITPAGPCGPNVFGAGQGGGDDVAEPPALPGTLPASGGAPSLNVVSSVAEQQVVELVCTGIAGTVLQLSNGDHVELPCPIEGSASLHIKTRTRCPQGWVADLPTSPACILEWPRSGGPRASGRHHRAAL